jgi:hypothetical protein
MTARTPSAARSAAPLTTAQVQALADKLADFIATELTAHTYAPKTDGPMAGKGDRQGALANGKIVVDGVKYQVGLNCTPLTAK